MPIYEYRCEHCGDFEEMQRMSDPPLAKCPKCKRKVRRLISNTSFQLKGTGWYVTDYAKSGSSGAGANGGKKDGGDTAASDSTSNGSATAKSETKKSETKTESKPAASSSDKSSS